VLRNEASEGEKKKEKHIDKRERAIIDAGVI
jgi:hypothetical protein